MGDDEEYNDTFTAIGYLCPCYLCLPLGIELPSAKKHKYGCRHGNDMECSHARKHGHGDCQAEMSITKKIVILLCAWNADCTQQKIRTETWYAKCTSCGTPGLVFYS